jgi:hypothetical protein
MCQDEQCSAVENNEEDEHRSGKHITDVISLVGLKRLVVAPEDAAPALNVRRTCKLK